MKQVVIIGRPNVGKSSFINRLVGKNIAITAHEEGVTRDIKYIQETWNGKLFEICDTGGVVFSKNTDNPYQKKINQRVQNELDNAYKILFMVDFNFPDHPEDMVIKRYLNSMLHKVILVINKVDNYDRQLALHPFFSYGINPIYPVSALQGHGIGDVLDDIVMHLSVNQTFNEPDSIDVAFIGKPNTGKSSLFNAIFNQEKALVDSKMGTTRDINVSSIVFEKTKINVIDTAGLRRRQTEAIEYFSSLRTSQAIENAAVIVCLVDAQDLLSDQDKKILNLIFSKNKNCIIFVNKWDLLERNSQTRSDIIARLTTTLPKLNHYPIIMGSASEKHNINALLTCIKRVYLASTHRVGTGELNQFLSRFFSMYHPPSKKGKQFKVFYATQVETSPPQFIFKVNDSSLLTQPFLRNFEREFRSFFPNSTGVGLAFIFRSKKNKK
jgi:GTP-binding protein